MPHKVGKKWKWGNIERSSKEDLRKTVYGIWMKNGSKGSFSKFWKTGKVNENESPILYRFCYDGTGIYEAAKQKIFDRYGKLDGKSKWLEIVNASKWLPKPNVKYGSHKSWFTEKGKDLFIKLVFPLLMQYLNKDYVQVIEKPDAAIEAAYRDKFQLVELSEAQEKKISFSKFWKTGKVNEDETVVNAKKIDFPADEIDSLKDRLSLVTTRVSDDFSKFAVGDIVIAPWGKKYCVTSRIEIDDINDHPYYDELTQDQVEFLSDYGKIAVLRLDEMQCLSSMVFKKVPRDELVPLLDEIETYNESKRFKREQFEKYLRSDKMIDHEDKSMYYGLFSIDGHCLALSYLNKTPADCILVAQISCVVPSYGRLLLEDIIRRSRAMWLAANPTAEDTLLDYYRTFGLEEVVLDHSKWADRKEEHFFLKADGERRDLILDTIESARV